MPGFELREQPKMGLTKLFDLTWTAIRYRLFRALMTVLVITVAVAFAVNLLLSGLNSRIVRNNTETELFELKTVSRWTSRISQTVDKDVVLREFAKSDLEEARAEEFIQFGLISPDEYPKLRQVAQEALAFIDFLNSLEYKERRELAGPVVGASILDHLAIPENRLKFLDTVGKFPTVRMEGSEEKFAALCQRWPETSRAIDAIKENWNASIARLLPLFVRQAPVEKLAEGSREFLDAIRKAGFLIDDLEFQRVSDLAKMEWLGIHLEASFAEPALKQALSRRLNMLPFEFEADRVWKRLQSASSAEWYRARYLEHARERMDWEAEDLQEIAQRRVRESRLQAAVNATSDAEDSAGLFGLSIKMSVLLIVSLMVCGVGITNALLMSVTERYREIATLKCLGALDISILWIFVMEASLQGVVGGIVGSLIGGLTSFAMALLSFGSIFLQDAPLLSMLQVFIVATIGGAFLAGAAAIYPSWKAARLAPLEAMRIE